MIRAAVFLALFSTHALACDTVPDRVSYVAAGKHYGGEVENYLSDNIQGAFVGWDCGRWGADLGVYLNSFEDISPIVTASFNVLQGENWDVGLFAGVAHYPDRGFHDGEPLGAGDIWLGGAQARYGNLVVQWMPSPDTKYFDGIVTAGFTFELES